MRKEAFDYRALIEVRAKPLDPACAESFYTQVLEQETFLAEELLQQQAFMEAAGSDRAVPV